MAGEGQAGAIADYLSRLTGRAVSVDEPLALRSIHRAAFTSWARQQGFPVPASLLSANAPFSVGQLLAAPAANPAATAPAAFVSGDADGGRAAGPRVGVDIEDVGRLPDAGDYREHPFYRDHFTSTEIAYCLRQADPKGAFCGAWAAKEAIVKAGLGPASLTHFNVIEIKHDADGRPRHPACELSISHTPGLAIAICVALPPAGPAEPPPAPITSESLPSRRPRAFALIGVVCLGALAGGGVVFALVCLNAWVGSGRL